MNLVSCQRVMALGAFALVLLTSASAAAIDAPAAKAAVDAQFVRDWPALKSLYEDIHAHPELGFQETRTAAELAARMRALGFTVTQHVGGTGLVAILHNGAGPTVMVRTELDALPLEEKTGLAYASRAKATWAGRETFVDHACGHDIHMAAWVGAAEFLSANKYRWHGTLKFVAQPAEEVVGGAHAMIKDGLFTRFAKPDYGFAQHVGNEAYGTIAYKSGIYSSNADGFVLRFDGRGGHGSKPSSTIDPIMMAARFVVDVQSVISREKDPAQFGVITVGSIQGGSAGNIIPDNAVVRGTIRSFTPEVRAKLKAGVARTAEAVAMMAAAPKPTLEFDDGATAVVNDDALTRRTAPVFKAAFGDKAVVMQAPQSASEDYSEFIEAGVPSLYYSLGGYPPEAVASARAGGPPLPSNHAPQFAPTPEPSIRTGVEAMSLAVLSVLGA